jgi:protein phosphatase
MLILPSINCKPGEMDFIFRDELPTFIANREQEESDDPISIYWIDNEICVLHEEDEFSYCCHISSGKKLWIYNSYLSQDKKSCYDYTDYLLPISKGDKLSLMLETSRGCLVKKDGVVGWYNVRRWRAESRYIDTR